MSKETKKLIIVFIAGMIIYAGLASIFRTIKSTGYVGTAGNLLAEDYLPFIRENNGYNSEKNISTSANMTTADLTTSDDLVVGDDATITGDLAVTSTVSISGGLTHGAGVRATTTTAAAETLTEAQLIANSYFLYEGSATAAAITVTLPATSTMTTLLPNAGDCREWVIENGYGASATTTTIAAGTGWDLQEPDGQNVVIGQNNYGWMKACRTNTTDVVGVVSESIPAD